VMLASACGSEGSSTSWVTCEDGEDGLCPEPSNTPDASAAPDATGTTERGDFPDPNGPPPPLETTCDCMDVDGDAICDSLDPCIDGIETCEGGPPAPSMSPTPAPSTSPSPAPSTSPS